MPPITHILFPFDFSDRCCHAVPFVRAIANRFGAKIAVISVVQPFADAARSGPVMIDPEEAICELTAKLKSLLTKEFPYLRTERIAEYGDPAQLIIDLAHSSDVDLLMMPIHGYDSFWTFLLGSVAAKVLHDAQCPVWTAVHLDEPPGRDHVTCSKILCAVGGTPKDISLIHWVARLARQTGATLRLVHVVPGMETWPAGQFDRSCEEEMNEAQQTVENLLKTGGINARLCVATGDIGEGVCGEARWYAAGLVVIGRSMLQETVSRHAYGIIGQSPCPVLSV
jgi:nucleotide-binding universal stress UspA family protein